MHMINPADVAAERMRQQQILYAWFSPSFPIGGFAFSHGLEWAHEIEAVTSLEALTQWLTDLVEHGSVRQDAILLASAYRAKLLGDDAALAEVIDLSFALQPSRERQMEAAVQGNAFAQLTAATYSTTTESSGRSSIPITDSARITLPVAVAIAGAAHRIDLLDLSLAYVSAFIANMCSAAVRLGVVGQTDGQRAIAALQPGVASLTIAACKLTLDDLGSAALRSDLFSLCHETQYSRLFRS